VQPFAVTGEGWTDLAGGVADRDDIVEALASVLVDRLGSLPGNIDADLWHQFDG
jgi:hypothetical protein